jgi:hypothetical protein
LRDPISMQSDLSGRVPALPSGRPWGQTLVVQKKKKKKIRV